MSGSIGHEVVIVGGGPAGASAACRLARRGRATLLLERGTQPRHKMCGEFLSIEAQTYLAGLGVDPRALGGASIGTVRLVCGPRVAEATLPFQGVGLTRRVLDEALLSRAATSGATVRRGVVAREIARDGPGLRVQLRDDDTIASRTVFLATGKHDLRRPKRPAGSSGADLIGFKTYFSLAPRQSAALQGAVEVILFEGGYAGLQHVEGGMVNLCLLARRALLERVGRSWAALLGHLCELEPYLRNRLEGAEPLIERPLSIAHMPYGFVHDAAEADPDGLFRLGDQMAVIPSFSGDGISIALHTGQAAAGLHLAHGHAAARYTRIMREDVGRQVGLATALYRLSQARFGRFALGQACRLYPGLLRTLAAWTRVPPPALERGRALGAWRVS